MYSGVSGQCSHTTTVEGSEHITKMSVGVLFGL